MNFKLPKMKLNEAETKELLSFDVSTSLNSYKEGGYSVKELAKIVRDQFDREDVINLISELQDLLAETQEVLPE